MVLRLGLDPDYVLDRMEMYEVRALLANDHMKSQENWERTRFLGFLMSKCSGSKIESITDLVKFPWDEKVPGKDKEIITKEDVNRLHELASVVAVSLKK